MAVPNPEQNLERNFSDKSERTTTEKRVSLIKEQLKRRENKCDKKKKKMTAGRKERDAFVNENTTDRFLNVLE